MKTAFALIPALLVLGSLSIPLAAQDPNVGIALSLGFPTGEFSSREFGPANNIWRDTYDTGFGGQFWLSFPVDRALAIRLTLSGMSTNGTSTGRNPGTRVYNLRHQIWSLGGDLQLFTESAMRHKGTYFFGGLSADFERFENSIFDLNTVDPYYIDSQRKSRMGGNLGIGHSFSFHSGLRFTMEGLYHKTLTGNDYGRGEPWSANFIKTNFGLVF